MWNLPDVPSLPGTGDRAPGPLICPCAIVLTPIPAASRPSAAFPIPPPGCRTTWRSHRSLFPSSFRSWDARRSTCSFRSHWRRARRVRSSPGISWALPAAPEVSCPDRKHRPASPLADTLDRDDRPGTSSRKHSLTCLDLIFRTTGDRADERTPAGCSLLQRRVRRASHCSPMKRAFAEGEVHRFELLHLPSGGPDPCGCALGRDDPSRFLDVDFRPSRAD